jgi:hypothetical protein
MDQPPVHQAVAHQEADHPMAKVPLVRHLPVHPAQSAVTQLREMAMGPGPAHQEVSHRMAIQVMELALVLPMEMVVAARNRARVQAPEVALAPVALELVALELVALEVVVALMGSAAVALLQTDQVRAAELILVHPV